MIYKYTSGWRVVNELDDKYNLTTNDYIGRTASWIATALGDLNIFPSLQPCVEPLTIEEYRAMLPFSIKVLRAVEYQGYKLRRVEGEANKNGSYRDDYENTVLTELIATVGTLTPRATNALHNIYQNVIIPNNFHPVEWYSLTPEGFINTSFEEGEIKVHFRAMPHEYNAKMQVRMPMIPDNTKVLEAICWYCLYRALSRGEQHPVYKLGSSVPHLDPYIMWERTKPKAENSIGALDADGRKRYHDLFTTFLVNQSAPETTFFKE